MIIRSLLVLLLLMPVTALAQGDASVAGRVLDMANDVPVGLATIVVESAANVTSRSGALAGEDGRFVLRGSRRGSTSFESLSQAFSKRKPTFS